MSKGVVAIPNNYTADWSQGHGLEWCEVAPYYPEDLATYNPTPPAAIQVNGEWRLRYSAVSDHGKICTMPRFVLSTRDSFEVEIPVTVAATAKAGRTYYFGIALYNGEASYFGVYLRARPDGTCDVYAHNCGYGAFETDPVSGSVYIDVFPPGWWSPGDKIFAKIVCDAAAGETRIYLRNQTDNPGGGYVLAWTRYHEVIASTDVRIGGLSGGAAAANFGWLEPVSLWLTGYSMASINVQAGWNVDIHPITIVRAGDRPILAGAGSHYPWSRFQNPLPSGFDSWDIQQDNLYAGAILYEEREALPEPAGMVATYAETEPYVLSVFQGQNTWLSPLISKPVGIGFSKLRLYGRNTAQVPEQVDGILEVKVLDAAGVPIAIGGQTSFFPDGGAFTPLEVDLSGVEEAQVRLSFFLQQNTPDVNVGYSAGFSYLDITPILFGFVLEGAVQQPPGPTLLARAILDAPVASGSRSATVSVSCFTASATLASVPVDGDVAVYAQAIVLPLTAVATLAPPAVNTGSGSIRAPDGSVLDLRDIHGQPLTTR